MLYNYGSLFNIDSFIEGVNIINTSPINNDFLIADISTAIIENGKFKTYVSSPFISSQITLNGVSLVTQDSPYFNYLQPYNYYKNTPDLGVNVYSFSLNPTETQPAGSCNLSRIPKSSLKFNILNPDNNLINVDTNNNYSVIDNLSFNNLNNYKIYVQVENYNILRFIGGIVGIAFTY